MEVDTGSFQALTDQVAELAEQMRKLRMWDACSDMFYTAGYETGRAAARNELLGKAAETSRPPRHRPSHLRPVDGGAS